MRDAVYEKKAQKRAHAHQLARKRARERERAEYTQGLQRYFSRAKPEPETETAGARARLKQRITSHYLVEVRRRCSDRHAVITIVNNEEAAPYLRIMVDGTMTLEVRFHLTGAPRPEVHAITTEGESVGAVPLHRWRLPSAAQAAVMREVIAAKNRLLASFDRMVDQAREKGLIVIEEPTDDPAV